MARPSNQSRLFSFDVDGYVSELRYSLRSAVREIKETLLKELKNSAKSLPFKRNPVRLAGGEVTSDYKRRRAVINAINASMDEIERDVIMLTFTALDNNFKDSHIGIYYEHGTGEEWDGEYETLPGIVPSPNKYRSGRQIVSRSKHIDYAGLGKGKWIDLGGNIRVTASREAGRRTPGFIAYIGEDTKAYHWFSSVFEEKREWIMKKLREAVMKVKPERFIRLSTKNFVLGKDGITK